MKPDPEKARVLGELSEAAEEAAKMERVLAEAQGVAPPAANRRKGERRALAERRFADRRSGGTGRE
jgi:hypothetical protein